MKSHFITRLGAPLLFILQQMKPDYFFIGITALIGAISTYWCIAST